MGKRAALADISGGSDLDIRQATGAIEENQPSAFRSAKKEPTCCGSGTTNVPPLPVLSLGQPLPREMTSHHSNEQVGESLWASRAREEAIS